ncbi:MAG: DUF3971 domain-containing protein [Alphaproteobacteria bacterium]|nr:DUF3971 domain-containing protein [Alphaproteobacteria bacterium]
MTDQGSSPRLAALEELQAALDEHRRAQMEAAPPPAMEPPKAPRRRWRLRVPAWRLPALRLPFDPGLLIGRGHPVIRRILIGAGAAMVAVLLAGGALVWRLSSGPIMLDLATPWLTSAIEQNFGSQYRVQVGGTQLERDAQGRTALRLRDIVVRDATGASVAVAPKAEVGISGTSLLIASPRAESFRLVDAQMSIRIDADGRVNVMIGGEKPIAVIAPDAPAQTASAPQSQPPLQTAAVPRAATPGRARLQSAPDPLRGLSLQNLADRSLVDNLAALMAWIDGLGSLSGEGSGGFDGRALTEIGVTNASLDIDDRRSDHRWQLKQISLRLSRPAEGGAALGILSDNPERPWVASAALLPGRQGHRRLQLEARRVVLEDLLALRMSEFRLRSDTLVSASIDSEIAVDGTPQTLVGTIVAQGGSIGDPADPVHRIPIGSMEFGLDWDIARRTLRVPFKVAAGSARYALRSEFAAPVQPGGNWIFALGGGWIVLEPPTPNDEGLVLKRVAVRGNIDPANRQVTIEHGDFGTKELGSKDERDVTIALSGKMNYGNDPRLAVGLAGNQMSAGALQRLWPTFIAPKVRDWVVQHIVSGTVERIDIATNTSLASLQPGGPPISDEGLAIEIVGRNAVLNPVAGLPPIRDADMRVRANGRSATVAMSKGTVDVSPGRRLTISDGLFEVPDTRPTAPPARVRFRVEGPVPAAAELLALERLREFSGAPFDPAATRGSLSAQVNLAMPLRPDLPKGSTEYNIGVELANFSVEKMLFGHRVEGQLLRAIATNRQYEIRGDIRIGGAPAQIEYRKLSTEPDAEFRLQATLDDAARVRLGLDVGNTIGGSLPMRLSGRVGGPGRDSRFAAEADLTGVRINNLLPGWVKPAGRPARVAFNVVKEKAGLRFDDLLIDGPGVLAKGTVEFSDSGDVESANFPVFATSDGDKTSIKVDRGADGALRVVMRGDVYDGRNFVKTAMSGPTDPKQAKARYPDLDIDIKLGVVAGHHGEALRGLDLRMSRRAGRVRTFTLNAKIGRDTPLIGEMRTRVANNRPVLYFETNDAGALFRFTDVYARMNGGAMWVGMDPPTQDAAPQEGLINVRNFSIRGEGALDRVVTGQGNQRASTSSIDFTQARADFVRTPGRMAIRDGVVKGPTIGATIEGNIDYVRDAVNVRGTLVPLYGLNNMFGQIPIVGLFLGGGSNEGIFGITYEVTGPTANPRPIVNPISAIAPGMLRKFFEFRDTQQTDRAFASEPTTR